MHQWEFDIHGEKNRCVEMLLTALISDILFTQNRETGAKFLYRISKTPPSKGGGVCW